MKSTTIVSGSDSNLSGTVVNIFDSGCVTIRDPAKPIIFRRNLLLRMEDSYEKDFTEGVLDEVATHRHYGFIQFDDGGIVTKTLNILLPVGEKENDIGAVLSDDEKIERNLRKLFEEGQALAFVKVIEKLLKK